MTVELVETIEWVSIQMVQEKTGIPDRTIRRYIQKHGNYLLTKKQDRNYLLSADCIHTLTQIRDLYNSGLNVDQVEEKLFQSRVPTVITVTEGNGQMTVPTTKALLDTLVGMTNAITDMTKRFDDMEKKQEEFLDAMDQRNEYIQRLLLERLPEPQAKRLGILTRMKGIISVDRFFSGRKQ